MIARTAYAPASCGEWLQGWLDGEAVLVSCPIDREVRACARPEAEGGLRVRPAERRKAAEAAALLLAGQAIEVPVPGFTLTIEDGLPLSRGYATSTADVSAGLAALAAALGQPLSAAEIASLACRVEPSDSIMFPEWSLLAYRTGAWHRPLGAGLRLPLVILDSGETLDTLRYNQQLDLRRVASLEGETRQALAALHEGLENSDPRALGEAARLSAVAYQRIRFSPLVEQALTWAQEYGAGGPLRAHSGSLVGLLFTDEEEAQTAVRRLGQAFMGEISLAHTVPGGVRLDGI